MLWSSLPTGPHGLPVTHQRPCPERAKQLKLLREIRAIEDVQKLDALCRVIEKGASLEEIQEKIDEGA